MSLENTRLFDARRLINPKIAKSDIGNVQYNDNGGEFKKETFAVQIAAIQAEALGTFAEATNELKLAEEANVVATSLVSIFFRFIQHITLYEKNVTFCFVIRRYAFYYRHTLCPVNTLKRFCKTTFHFVTIFIQTKHASVATFAI